MDTPGINVEATGKVVGLLIAVGTVIAAPFKVFLTKASAEKIYLKRLEDDGSTHYVRTVDFERIEKAVTESTEESRKWRAMAKDWMEMP